MTQPNKATLKPVGEKKPMPSNYDKRALTAMLREVVTHELVNLPDWLCRVAEDCNLEPMTAAKYLCSFMNRVTA